MEENQIIRFQDFKYDVELYQFQKDRNIKIIKTEIIIVKEYVEFINNNYFNSFVDVPYVRLFYSCL